MMASRSEFSEAEWESLRKGATGAGMLVAVSDRGFFDTFKEAGALAKHLAEARSGSTSDLVRDLAGERGTGFGLTSSPSEIESETLQALDSAVATLRTKAPEELAPYRRFVLDLAESVSKAAGGGDSAEQAVVEKVRSRLDAAPAP
jgi:hypothetical protein